jgi:hypothetical protein
MTTCMGFLWFQRGFVLKNPVPEILAGHGLREITGGFGVLFQLPGNFLNNSYPDEQDHQGHKKIFSATEKNHKNPEYPVFTIRPGEIDASPGLAKKF